MTYPAEINFKRDRTLSATARRVYDYLTTMLDFTEVRPVKAGVLCEAWAVDPKTFRASLGQLVAGGYLIEHARGLHAVRRFTLAWSINETVERTGAA